MRKFGVFTTIIFITILLAGVFGILHDQITYSISPEYFTKFKYRQFDFNPDMFDGHRQTVAVIGFFAAWWMGLIIGLGLGLTGLTFRNHSEMKKNLWVAVKFVFLIALAFSFIGFLWGKFFLVNNGVSWSVPADLIDRDSYIITGSIHNFSYIGAVIGLLFGIVYLLRKKVPSKTK